jgi:hypothetical protein
MGRAPLRRQRGRRRLLVGAAVALGAAAPWSVPRPVQAEVVYELAPSTFLGATSTSQALSNGEASVFSSASGLARVLRDGPRARFNLGYRFLYTHFFQTGRDTFGNELVATSQFDLTGALMLSLAGNVLATRTSQVDAANLAGQAALPGSRFFVASSARQDLIYQATTRLRFQQGLGVNRVDWLSSSLEPIPDTLTATSSTALHAQLRSDYSWARDNVFIETRGTDLIAGDRMTPAGMLVPGGHTLIGQAMAGWRRELSLAWSAELQGGVGVLSRPVGEMVRAPLGIATLDYRRLPWYSTLTVQRMTVLNYFIGVATINDQAALRLTVPLNRSEFTVLSGFAVYTRARPADPISAAYNYDQAAVGGTISHRIKNMPFAGSFTYTLIDQRGTTSSGQPLDLVRHTFFLNLTANFQFGPRAPPAFGGNGGLL